MYLLTKGTLEFMETGWAMGLGWVIICIIYILMGVIVGIFVSTMMILIIPKDFFVLNKMMHKTFSKLKGFCFHYFEVCICGKDHMDYIFGDSGTEGHRYNGGNGCGYDGSFIDFCGNGGSSSCDSWDFDDITNIFYFIEDAND
jgi:hypothetical protein